VRILFFGNQDNLGYELCRWCRDYGVDGEVYSFDHDLPRSQPELVEPAVADAYPEWFHVHPSPVSHAPLIGRTLRRRLQTEFDVLVVSGTRGLLASRRLRLPKVMYAIGGDVAEAPFPFAARWQGLTAGIFRVLRFPFARSAIHRMDAIIENYEVNLNALRRLGLIERRICLGMPEDAGRNLALVDHAILKNLAERYGDYRRVFLWLTRINFLDPQDAAYKGAERFLDALEFVRGDIAAEQVRLVVGAHGHDVEAFRRRVAKKDLTKHVDWVPHLSYSRMLTYMAMPNAVVFGKFGEFLGMPAAIDRDSFTLGAVLISTVDKECANAIYGAPPPVLDAVTISEIGRRMREVIDMSDDELRAWQEKIRRYGADYIDYHAIIPKFLEQLKQVLGRSIQGRSDGATTASTAT
jgi:hypothetical protein